MKKWFETKDSKLTIDLNEVVAMTKDQAFVFDQQKNMNVEAFLLLFQLEKKQVPYVTDSSSDRDLEYLRAKELLLKGD